ncbi:hypothetical protein TWF730_001687 [Orbilia blumenaviensis]|uniref:Uncharacterized protein n=1 Tax=Orbilia blumenaviensis TaxID=1796055 RepID=A0AAV9UM34_9PEZI
MVSVAEAELFLETLVEVFGRVKGGLKVLRVHLSDIMPYRHNKRLLSLVCQPDSQRSYNLSIAYTFRNFRTVEMFLHPLSNCNTLDLWFEGWMGTQITESEIHPVIETFSRCPSLREISIKTRFHDFTYEASRDLWLALAKVEGLERVKVASASNSLPDYDAIPVLKWIGIKKFEMVQADRFPERNSAQIQGLLQGVRSAGGRLEKLVLTRYDYEIQKELMFHTHITDLEIRSKLGSLIANYADSLWGELVPALAGGLRRLKVYVYAEDAKVPDKVLSWYGADNNMAKAALRKCRKLEEVSVPFWERDSQEPPWLSLATKSNKKNNYIIEMMEDLLKHCPRLSRLNIKFCMGYRDTKLESTEKLLGEWISSKEMGSLLFGREFEVAYFNKTYMDWTFRLKSGGGLFARPIAWDFYLQRWKLVRLAENGDRLYTLERMEDEYCFDE